jgi:hypothetical protein
LLIKNADGTTAKHRTGFWMMAARTFQATTNKRLIAMQLAVMAGHQAQTPKGTMEAL